MLETIGFAFASLLMDLFGQKTTSTEVAAIISWQEAKVFDVPTQADSKVEAIVKDYLKRLAAQGYAIEQQGIWLQSEWAQLARHQDSLPASAASLTKIATTIAALETWSLDRRFETRIYQTGTLNNGVVEGDLIVQGDGDPLFVWEEAIALGNALNQLGIRQIKGNLIVAGKFYMNFKSDPQASGELLKLGLDSRRWTPLIQKQYQSMPSQTPRPQVAIAGGIQVRRDSLPDASQLLLRHQSLTLAQLLKKMNVYSNNVMSEMIGDAVGGAAAVSQIAAKFARVSPDEIQLINTSGLGVENRISPRAACQMLMALQDKLKSHSLSVADLFPVGGRDRNGTMQWRSIPSGIAVKTGTLAQVSALAGVIPTKERGLVWFAIINRGGNIERLRAEQDRLLQRLSQHWNVIPATANSVTNNAFFGDPNRNLKTDG